MPLNQLFEKIKDTHPTLIKYDELKSIPIGEVVELDEYLSFERLPASRMLFFRVELKKGGLIENNFKDCQEDIILYSGHVREIISNRELLRSKVYHIPIDKEHIMYATTDCVFYSQLYR